MALMRSLRATTILSSSPLELRRSRRETRVTGQFGIPLDSLVQGAHRSGEATLGLHIVPEPLRLGDEPVCVQEGDHLVTGRMTSSSTSRSAGALARTASTNAGT
jgi:hypothetical protein